MPRRSARANDPAPEELPAQDELPEVHDEDMDIDEEEQKSLEFDEELSWRPAKPIPSATLLTRLEKLSKELADFDQGAVVLSSLQRVAADLAHRNLLQHKDRGVKAYTACCLVDLLRLYVPDAPFTEEQLKVSIFIFLSRQKLIPADDVHSLRQRYPPSSS